MPKLMQLSDINDAILHYIITKDRELCHHKFVDHNSCGYCSQITDLLCDKAVNMI